METKFLKPKEVAENLGLKSSTINDLIKAGYLKALDVRREKGVGRAFFRVYTEDFFNFVHGIDHGISLMWPEDAKGAA